MMVVVVVSLLLMASRWQLFVYFLRESPHHTFNRSRRYTNRFNVTMTYRHDSDIAGQSADWSQGTAKPANYQLKYQLSAKSRNVAGWQPLPDSEQTGAARRCLGQIHRRVRSGDPHKWPEASRPGTVRTPSTRLSELWRTASGPGLTGTRKKDLQQTGGWAGFPSGPEGPNNSKPGGPGREYPLKKTNRG